MKIAHFINPWLPITQNWIYNQIIFNKECEHIILCRTLLNRAQFPCNTIFPAYPKSGFRSFLDITVARFQAQYPLGFYHSIIKKEIPDVLHGHFAWESWRNIQLIKRLKIPLITTFYGLDVNKHPKKNCWRKRYEQLFKIGTLFTVEGPFMASSLEQLGCPKEKIRIIHLGVDIERITQSVSKKSSETFNILFVGLEREKKGSIYAAKAFAKAAKEFGHVRLHILGDGRYRKIIEKILTDENVIDKTRFYGYVPVHRYYELLGTMSCIMAPSVTAANGDTEGGAPVSIIEAQAIGIPVVGTTHCDIPEIVIHNKTGLLCPEKDIEQLTTNLILLIGNKQLQKDLGNAGRDHMLQQHDIRKQSKKINDMYREVVKH